ncbi:MAG TPA: hypothetical protein VEL70_08355 [Candidatus Acidoferrum sp.]|nr:hypothetical protein [Candidatus Acidoferrum sp.]
MTESIFRLPCTSMKFAGKVLLAIPALATLELIFSHLVSVESIWNVAPLAITRFAFRNHSPFCDCLARILLSWSLLSISVSLAELQVTVIVLVAGL